MGTVLDLKLRGSNDWTAFEKIQLESLMDCLPARAASDLAFGVTDTGDPWCAVMNEDGDVVMHIARIQGRFFVHSTVEPFVADARDLSSAVSPFVENFRRPTATITPLFDTPMPLHAYAAFDGAPPEASFGADWVHDAPAAGDADAYAVQSLPDAPDPWHAPPGMLVDNDAPALAELAQTTAPADADPGPAFLPHDDLTVNYELFFRASDEVRTDNAAADMVAQAANDEGAAPAAAAPVFAPLTASADNVLIFPGPTQTVTTTDAPVPPPSMGSHTDLVENLVRAAAGQEADHIDVELIPAWDVGHPVDLSGVLPTAEAF